MKFGVCYNVLFVLQRSQTTETTRAHAVLYQQCVRYGKIVDKYPDKGWYCIELIPFL